jgi:two-component system, chemotaxis family, chemotaxis protein CheY
VDGYGKRVLVVEDDQDIRSVLCLMLSEAGYNVYEACDGLEALDALKKRRYDAVLTDYHMPKMDGLELLDLVQAMWADTPVIVASSDRLLTERALDNLLAPAYAVLSKPFDSSYLLNAVRSATSGVPKSARLPELRPIYQAAA